jgi:hypothetical protein
VKILFVFLFTYRRGKVPDVLFTTIELPEGVLTTGKGCFLQAYVCRPKRDCRGEMNAKEISDGLPFLEYELHRLLINKLKVKGMNSIFGLKVREIVIKESLTYFHFLPGLVIMCLCTTCTNCTKSKLRGLSPRANHTDRATAICR